MPRRMEKEKERERGREGGEERWERAEKQKREGKRMKNRNDESENGIEDEKTRLINNYSLCGRLNGFFIKFTLISSEFNVVFVNFIFFLHHFFVDVFITFMFITFVLSLNCFQVWFSLELIPRFKGLV